ncbi:MAG: hypothetical protein HY930_04625 [Euryarchaeota archaeon]|nr:hypothetical protein [Euryarchaeota archaeon]
MNNFVKAIRNSINLLDIITKKKIRFKSKDGCPKCEKNRRQFKFNLCVECSKKFREYSPKRQDKFVKKIKHKIRNTPFDAITKCAMYRKIKMEPSDVINMGFFCTYCGYQEIAVEAYSSK